MSIMLVSTEDAKLFLGLKTEDEHDDLIELIIEQVSARIETYLNRELKAEERTKYFDAGKDSYSLPAYPVDTGETFTVNHDDVELTIDEDYYLHDEIGVVEFPLGTGEYKVRSIDVTCTGGYTEGSGVLAVPDDLKRACLMQTVYDFRRRNDLGLSSVSMPDGSVSIYQPARFLSEVEAILMTHRRLPIQ